MKLLYLITRAEPGGAQSHLLELLESLRSGWDVNLATGEEGILTSEARRLKVNVYILPNLVQPVNLIKDVKALREILALFRQLRPSLVHAHSSKAGFLGRIAARMAGVPVIFTAHGWGFADGVPWRRKMVAVLGEQIASRFSGGIITVSDADRLLALRYRVASGRSITVIHNGIRDKSDQTCVSDSNEARIAMIARFAPQKDHALLLNALAGHQKPFQLYFIGEGSSQTKVKDLVRELGLSGRVNFLGAVNNVNQILAEVNIFVLASNWEGFPISILEAMRAGLPVIASDVGGVREAVVDGETGFLVNRGNLVMLRDSLQQLMNNPVLRKKMGEAGRKRYLEHFTVERMLNQTLQVYKQVLKKDFSMR